MHGPEQTAVIAAQGRLGLSDSAIQLEFFFINPTLAHHGHRTSPPISDTPFIQARVRGCIGREEVAYGPLTGAGQAGARSR